MTNPSNGQPTEQTQALTPYQVRSLELREGIGQDARPAAIIPRTFAEAQSFANAISQSALVPDALRNRAPDVLMIVLAGAELELPPIRSLSLFHVIEGVPKLSADGLAARIRSSPLCDYFEPSEETDTHVSWIGKRVGRPELKVTYRIADAEKANLIRKTRNGEPNNWMKFPKDMMHARAKARLARLVWPDLAAGITTAEEAADVYEGPTRGAAFSEVPPPAPTTKPITDEAVARSGDPTQPTPSQNKATRGKKPPPVIDAKSSEQNSTPPSTSSAPTTSSNSSPPPSAASVYQIADQVNPTSSSPAPSATASSPAPAEGIASGATASSSPAASQPSAPVEDESGFGDDDSESAEDVPPVRTIEAFERDLDAIVAQRNPDELKRVKADWLPWSKDESATGGKRYAVRMREAFSKAQTALGIK